MQRTAALLACLVLSPGLAEDAPQQEDLDVPPALEEQPPPDLEPGAEPLEPEVTIIRREDATVEEYRVNGQLYMIRVIPVSGPAYYLVDTNGDGELDLRGDGLEPPGMFQWLLYSW